MANVDPRTVSCEEAIRHAWTVSPSLFILKLKEARMVHENHAAFTTNHRASVIASSMANDCTLVADYLEAGDFAAILRDVSYRVIAFNIAADILVIPRNWRAEIVERVAA